MQQFKLILILASCLVLKATMVAGAEMEKSGTENINTTMAVADKTIANPDYVAPDPYALNWEQMTKYAQNETNTNETAKVTETAKTLESSTVSDAPKLNNTVHVNIQDNDTKNSHNQNDSGSVLGSRINDSNTVPQASITTMVGLGDYYGAWANHVSNTYNLGLGLEMALNSLISIEVEGGYGRYNVAYQYFRHDFNQYNIGGNAKLYLSRSMIQPWIGFGAMGLYYENMSHGPSFPYSNYSQWVGAIQPIAGVDVEVAKGIAVGARGAYVVPVFNKPRTLDNGVYSYPYYEEAGLMNTSFYKVMAQVKIMF